MARPRGALNKKTIEAKALCNRIVDDPRYYRALHKRMIKGTAGAMEPIVWYYAKGKPKERVELGADKSLAYLIAEAAGVLPKEGE
ncbi:MAG TPA: hypothetical protein VKB41_08530 [Steroidobacteraceae bacterium]|nr:hypothetical protein [Steroidobacteraceae bacterium]